MSLPRDSDLLATRWKECTIYGSVRSEQELEMHQPLTDQALDQVFREARTYTTWLDKPVTDDILRRLYDLMKWGPTSVNSSPARILFLRTPEAKERLRPLLSPGNVD